MKIFRAYFSDRISLSPITTQPGPQPPHLHLTRTPYFARAKFEKQTAFDRLFLVMIRNLCMGAGGTASPYAQSALLICAIRCDRLPRLDPDYQPIRMISIPYRCFGGAMIENTGSYLTASAVMTFIDGLFLQDLRLFTSPSSLRRRDLIILHQMALLVMLTTHFHSSVMCLVTRTTSISICHNVFVDYSRLFTMIHEPFG